MLATVPAGEATGLSCRLGVDELAVLAVGEGGGARSHGDGGAGESQHPVVGS
jgi:hypothetical protein